jgi:nitric oxide reductase NorQ protein
MSAPRAIRGVVAHETDLALEHVSAEPYYRPRKDEIAVFSAARGRRLPIMLKGPTGCGKTRFVRHMAWRLGRPLVTVACHDDLSANDLTGRFLVRGGEIVWQDGPLTMAARAGALCYLDEIVEARQDTVVAIHPLTDDRRLLPVEKAAELVEAHPDFQLVVSYNPGYQNVMKDLKPSTRQRFVTIDFDFPPPEDEIEIVRQEAGVERGLAASLVKLAGRVRRLRDHGLVEIASTRLLIHAACLAAGGLDLRRACEAAIAGPLSDDPDLLGAVSEVIGAVLV